MNIIKKIFKWIFKWIGLLILAVFVLLIMEVPAMEETPSYQFYGQAQFNAALKRVNLANNFGLTIIFTIITLFLEWYLCKWAGNKLNFRQHLSVKNIFIALINGALACVIAILLKIHPANGNGAHVHIYQDIFTATLRSSVGLGFLIVISSIIIGPIVEELLFQGAIQKGFFKKLNPWISIILTAIIFAACHNIALNLDFLGKVIAGVLYGYTYQKTNDIKMPILAHGVYNLIVTIFLFIGAFG